MEHRTEVREKTHRKVRYLLWNRAQIEERGNGGTVQQRGQGWRFAASAARITEETTGSEDCKHTSRGLWVAIDSNLGAVVGAEEGAIESILGNCPCLGACQKRFACFLGVLLALRRLDSKE